MQCRGGIKDRDGINRVMLLERASNGAAQRFRDYQGKHLMGGNLLGRNVTQILLTVNFQPCTLEPTL